MRKHAGWRREPNDSEEPLEPVDDDRPPWPEDLPQENDMALIPPGQYCYAVLDRECIPYRTQTCPYWDVRDDKPPQQRGYCHYLRVGDWQEGGTSFLWDRVKECGINQGFPGDVEDRG